MGMQRGLFIYLLLITESCLLLKCSPGFLPWKSSQRGQGKQDEVFVFSLKLLLWQKHLPAARNQTRLRAGGQCCGTDLPVCKRASIPRLGQWDQHVEVVHVLSLSRKPPSDSWLCDLALTPWKSHYHLLTQLLFSFLMTEICTVFNANRGNTFIALSKKFWWFKAMVRKLEWLNSSVSAHPALNTLCSLLRKTSYKILPRRYFFLHVLDLLRGCRAQFKVTCTVCLQEQPVLCRKPSSCWNSPLQTPDLTVPWFFSWARPDVWVSARAMLSKNGLYHP